MKLINLIQRRLGISPLRSILLLAIAFAPAGCDQASEALEEEKANLGNVNVPSTKTIDQGERTVFDDIVEVVGASNGAKAQQLAAQIEAFDDRSIATILEFLDIAAEKDFALDELIAALGDDSYQLVEILTAIASSDGTNLNIQKVFAAARGEAYCADVSHGSTQTRSRFLDSIVMLGSSCQPQDQERSCSDGSFSEWSGTYTNETCQISGCMDDRYHEYSAEVEVSDPSACLNFNVCTTWADSGRTSGSDIDGDALQDYAGGDGTPGDPYLVCDVAGLEKIGSYLSKSYQQAQNIDLSGYEHSSEPGEGKGWLPLGSYANEFTGSYDGTNFKIMNLQINRPADLYVGLFGDSTNSAVRNITLEDPQVIGLRAVGGIIGRITNGIVTNLKTTLNSCDASVCTVETSDTVSSAKDFVGGVVGRCAYCLLNNLENNVTVRGDGFVGGVVGNALLAYDAANLTNHGKVMYKNSGFSSTEMGGVFGILVIDGPGVDVKNLLNTATVEFAKNGNRIAGTVGFYDVQSNGSTSVIKNLKNTGTVLRNGASASLSGSIGGVMGGTIYDSSFAAPNMSHFLNKGDVSGASRAGGVIGSVNGNITLTNFVNTNTNIASSTSRSTLLGNEAGHTITYNQCYGVAVASESYSVGGQTNIADLNTVVIAGNNFTAAEGWSNAPVNLEFID